jgi:hypothetical protein
MCTSRLALEKACAVPVGNAAAAEWWTKVHLALGAPAVAASSTWTTSQHRAGPLGWTACAC